MGDILFPTAFTQAIPIIMVGQDNAYPTTVLEPFSAIIRTSRLVLRYANTLSWCLFNCVWNFLHNFWRNCSTPWFSTNIIPVRQRNAGIIQHLNLCVVLRSLRSKDTKNDIENEKQIASKEAEKEDSKTRGLFLYIKN